VLIAERDILFAGGVFMGNIEFDPPICLENETTVVLVLETPNLFNGTNLPTGIPAGAGYRSGIGLGVLAGAPSNVWSRARLCGNTQFGAIGAGSYQWPIQMNGQLAQCGSGSNCPADYNTDGVVDGDDLGVLLSAWDTVAGDLNGDGVTDGGDLGILLSTWGTCAP
jgi:hypothetical protein